jgi:dienelactone hydrolase
MKHFTMADLAVMKKDPLLRWSLLLVLAIAALHASILSARAQSDSSLLWGNLKHGRFTIGFRVINALDSSRSDLHDNNARHIQVSVWYPAQSSHRGTRLTYRDYFLLSASELDFHGLSDAKREEEIESYKRLLAGNGVPAQAADRWFKSPMQAFRGAEPIPDKLPLIIVAQGNMQSAHHQSILCEYLASHGFVVATCPSQTRLSGTIDSDTSVTSSAQEQAADMEFVVQVVQSTFNVDSARLGLVAHSFGARSALLYVARHPSVRAFVSLDGGIGSSQAQDYATMVPGFDPSRIMTPLLHFYEENDPAMSPDFTLIRSLHESERFLIKVSDFRHPYFTSLGMAASTVEGFLGSSNQANDESMQLKEKCGAIYEISEKFLHFFLLQAADSSAEGTRLHSEPAIRPLEHIMEMTRLPPGK